MYSECRHGGRPQNLRGRALVEGHNPFFSRGGLSKTWPEGHIMYNSFPQKLAKASLFSKCIFSLGPSSK